MSLTHGVSTSHGYTGPVQNFRTAKEGEQALARDANGDVQETTEYNLMRVVEFDWLLDSGDTAPAYGNTITVAGGVGLSTATRRRKPRKGEVWLRKYQ